MTLVGGAADCILDDDHAISDVDGLHDGRQHAHIGFAAGDDQSVGLLAIERDLQQPLGKGGLGVLVEYSSGRCV